MMKSGGNGGKVVLASFIHRNWCGPSRRERWHRHIASLQNAVQPYRSSLSYGKVEFTKIGSLLEKASSSHFETWGTDGLVQRTVEGEGQAGLEGVQDSRWQEVNRNFPPVVFISVQLFVQGGRPGQVITE